MELKTEHPLKSYNTFGISSHARYFAEVSSVDEIRECLQQKEIQGMNQLILGGGSNVLFTQNYDGLVLKVNITGKELVGEDADHYYVRVGAGENWHQFVLYCLEHNYAGAENLSLIPGNVGAAPMQNIGAYGTEIKAIFHELEAVFIDSGATKTFSAGECNFGYRESIFKGELKNKCVITTVTFRLNKKEHLNTSYGSIEQELEEMGIQQPNIHSVSQAVCNIRRSKLPDPTKIGNAGSFFKNPVIPTGQFEALKSDFPDIVGYKNSDTMTKVAAGWLIEATGWKGKRLGDYGVHTRQALVLVNYGNAVGNDIWQLAMDIQTSVSDKFGIKLSPEVNII